jgi:circadian clock protein KaiC
MPTADRRLPSGSADLDRILGGGLPLGSTIVIGGPPGSGKTLLAQQLAFVNATEAAPALYYTSWSEPHTKLIRNLSAFDFFDEQAIGKRIDFLHLPALVDVAGERGLEEVSREVFRASVERQPVMVVIDSSKSLHGLVPEDRLRRVIYELASRVGQTDTVLVLVGEYTPGEIESEPEFAVADGVIQLANEARGLNDQRLLRVVKMRGSANLSGSHAFSIDRRGVCAYPRAETIVPPDIELQEGRASLGDAALDQLLGGGLPRGDATLLLGPAGIGKTILSLGFVAAGLKEGERGLYMSLQETRAELISTAVAMGWDWVPAAVARGDLQLLNIRPVDVELDQIGVALRDALVAQQPRRVIVDSIAELDVGGRAPDRYLSYLWAIVALVRAAGATGIFTQETTTFGPPATAQVLSYVFQNVLTMRFVEHDYRVLRSVSTLKTRHSRHETDLLEFDIAPGGVTSGDKLTGVTGLLGWTALHKEP